MPFVASPPGIPDVFTEQDDTLFNGPGLVVTPLHPPSNTGTSQFGQPTGIDTVTQHYGYITGLQVYESIGGGGGDVPTTYTQVHSHTATPFHDVNSTTISALTYDGAASLETQMFFGIQEPTVGDTPIVVNPLWLTAVESTDTTLMMMTGAENEDYTLTVETERGTNAGLNIVTSGSGQLKVNGTPVGGGGAGSVTWTNVAQNGCTPDGVTNNLDPLTTLINAATAGTTLYFPATSAGTAYLVIGNLPAIPAAVNIWMDEGVQIQGQNQTGNAIIEITGDGSITGLSVQCVDNSTVPLVQLDCDGPSGNTWMSGGELVAGSSGNVMLSIDSSLGTGQVVYVDGVVFFGLVLPGNSAVMVADSAAALNKLVLSNLDFTLTEAYTDPTDGLIYVTADVNYFAVTFCSSALPHYNYGIQVAAGTSDHYTIIGNDFSNALTEAISDGGTGTHKLVLNM